MNFLDSIKNVDFRGHAQSFMNATSNFVARRDALTVFATSKVALGVFLGVALVTGMAIYYCSKKTKAANEKPVEKFTILNPNSKKAQRRAVKREREALNDALPQNSIPAPQNTSFGISRIFSKFFK